MIYGFQRDIAQVRLANDPFMHTQAVQKKMSIVLNTFGAISPTTFSNSFSWIDSLYFG